MKEAEGDQLPAAHTVSQDETCNSRTLKAGTLEKLVENLLMAFGDNDFKYISVFLSTYRAFASTSTVLELLLDRYGNLEISGSKEVGNQNSPESTTVLSIVIASILQAWLDQCSEDFQEPPNYICLMKVLNYMKRNIPGSDLEKRAQNLLEQFQKEELENDGEVPFSVCCPSVKPGTSPCPDGYHSLSPCNPDDDEELEISSPEEFSFFQEEIVAEQLTYMDMTLFREVVPHHCLGCVWSRRDRQENKHLAGSIRATILQFNAVTNRVVSTILESKELKTQKRAKILENWIRIARECRILNNFSSLKAVISALQSTSIYHLKKTWACVPEYSYANEHGTFAVHEIINQALEKLEEMQVPMPDYALKSTGAVTLYKQTSSKALPVQIDKMGIGTCPGPDNHPGNCWPFPGSQGHVFIKLSMLVIPRAVTMAHVSGTAFHGESISGAPKDFAVYGSKEEHEEQGTFLGQFTFLAMRNPSQTFQLKISHSLGQHTLQSTWVTPSVQERLQDHHKGPQEGSGWPRSTNSEAAAEAECPAPAPQGPTADDTALWDTAQRIVSEAVRRAVAEIVAAGQEPEEQQDLAQCMDLQDENSKEGCQGGESIHSIWINPSVQEHLQDVPAGPQEGSGLPSCTDTEAAAEAERPAPAQHSPTEDDVDLSDIVEYIVSEAVRRAEAEIQGPGQQLVEQQDLVQCTDVPMAAPAPAGLEAIEAHLAGEDERQASTAPLVPAAKEEEGNAHDSEEQGHTEHCDLHLPLRCREFWVMPEKKSKGASEWNIKSST
ncbi:hypothetical protein Q9966_015877 [Columba livia]|nr:hypothetical protein Q9966_015877 [Columba livia]